MSEAISLSDLDLDFEPSGVMDYDEPVIVRVGNKLVVGYLSDDSDCENPLKSCDGMGRIYSAHRDSDSEEHRAMQDAMGLDSDWNPVIDQSDIEDAASKSLRAIVKSDFNSEFIGCVLHFGSVDRAWQAFVEDFKLGEYYCNLDFTRKVIGATSKSWEDICKGSWEVARRAGSVGDPYAVKLDCYQHSGTVWSISGEGMQCQFDTAKGAGVWVPDDSARDEAERREKVYAFGRTFQLHGPTPWHAALDDQDETSPGFALWHEAFTWLEQHQPKREPTAEEALLGRERAARNLAQVALESYNAWLSGDCYGVIVVTFVNVAGFWKDPEWELVDSDECWGYIGSEYAMEDVHSNVASTIKYLEAEDNQLAIAA